MDDWVDVLLALLLAAAVSLLVFLGVALVADGMSTGAGTVTDKYYDDPDLVCSKGCFYTPECWTIVLGSEPWWNDTACVDESDYHKIEVGDDFIGS